MNPATILLAFACARDPAPSAETHGSDTATPPDPTADGPVDIRDLATGYWGETDSYNFGEVIRIINAGGQDVVAIGQPVPDAAGRIYLIGPSGEAMVSLMVQDAPYHFDDHLGRILTGAEIDGQPALVAGYSLDSGEQFLVGWPLDDRSRDLGPGDLLFRQPLATELRLGADQVNYGPDLTEDGRSDLFCLEHITGGEVILAWPGPLSSGSLAISPARLPLPGGLAAANAIELTRPPSVSSSLAMAIPDEPGWPISSYLQFFESGVDAGRIDIRSPSQSPRLHAIRPDMDGDGTPERCVADGSWMDGEVHTGLVACFPDATGGTLRLDEASTVLLGVEADSSFGDSLAAVDLDGDGRDELIVGAPMVGIHYRYGFIHVLKMIDGNLTVHATFSDFQNDAGFGREVAVGDLDGDEKPDVVASAFHACLDGGRPSDPDASCPGAVWVIPGAAGLW